MGRVRLKLHSDRCDGHGWSKFQDCVTEALYCLSLDGADDDTGSDDFQGWYGLMLCPFGEDPHKCESEVCAHGVTVPRGFYVIHQSTNGAVYSYRFRTENAARRMFSRAQREYGKWLDQDES